MGDERDFRELSADELRGIEPDEMIVKREDYAALGRTSMRNISACGVISAILGALAGYAVGISPGLGKELSQRDSRLPEVRDNQQLVLHPDYLQGNVSLGYTLLTDEDHRAGWDLAERVHIGFTPGDSNRTLFYKEGFGLARAAGDSVTSVKFVEPEFFRAFE